MFHQLFLLEQSTYCELDEKAPLAPSTKALALGPPFRLSSV